MPIASPTDDEKVKIFRLSIEESRRTYDHICNIYDQLRVKALALIAGEIAIVAFIFSGDSLKIPTTPYGAIFFFAAMLVMLCAFGCFFWTLAGLKWRIPSDLATSDTLEKTYDTELEFLRYINDDYSQVTRDCSSKVSKKSKVFDVGLYMLAAGAIILLVIKFGDGHL